MPRATTKKKPKVATVDRCEAFIRVAAGKVPPPFDRETIAQIVGERSVKTLAEVAKAFGCGAQTPRKEWRSSGMPGEAGNWNLVDITIWLLERAFKETERQASVTNPDNERLKEIDLRLAELNLSKREREEKEASGQLLDLFLARAELSAALTVFRKSLLGIPQKLQPMWRREDAQRNGEIINGEVRRVLHFLIEELPRSLRRNTSEHHQNILRQVDELERQNTSDRSSEAI